MFKSKKVPAAPRSMDEITKEYQKAMAELASATYQSHVYGKEAQRLNGVLEQLSLEGSARKELDAAVAADKKEA